MDAVVGDIGGGLTQLAGILVVLFPVLLLLNARARRLGHRTQTRVGLLAFFLVAPVSFVAVHLLWLGYFMRPMPASIEVLSVGLFLVSLGAVFFGWGAIVRAALFLPGVEPSDRVGISGE